MKKIVVLIMLFAVLTFCLPFVALILPADTILANAAPPASTVANLTDTTLTTQNGASLQNIALLDQSTGKVFTVAPLEYIIGAISAEMPPSWPDEALKAQGVAAYSYLLAQKDSAAKDASLKGAYLKVNPPLRLGYVTDEVRKMMWASEYEQNAKRITEIAQSILGEVLMYDGKPALACYHAISSGVTEASENIWGTALNYLVSVQSTDDINADKYETKTEIELSKVKEALTMNFAGMKFDEKPELWFTNQAISPSGYTKEITICGVTVKGLDFRNALDLRSTCFSVDFKDDIFTFTTKGYGHGAGLSQYGACSMARAGKTYTEILAHYYPETQLSK